MIRRLDVITRLVRDLGEAVRFDAEALGFQKRADISMPAGYRWVTVGVPGQAGAGLTFQLANTEAERQAVGRQAVMGGFSQ